MSTLRGEVPPIQPLNHACPICGVLLPVDSPLYVVCSCNSINHWHGHCWRVARKAELESVPPDLRAALEAEQIRIIMSRI